MRIIKASTVVVDANLAIVGRILKCVGHPEALVTDKTWLNDFFWGDPARAEEVRIALNAEFGIYLESVDIKLPVLIQMIKEKP